ncbi:MAG: RNA polymerase sigma factor [Oscillospiraceae bacterium]|nr:RNA polymerase sigma factor [Oscillospiraceae bacterium]
MLICLYVFDTDEERMILAEFYHEHKDKCLKAALAVTGNHAIAEEAVQEAFLKMIRRKEKYFSNSCKRTGTLIVIMVKSAAIDILRREKRLGHAMIDDFEPVIDNEKPDILRIIEGKEAVERLQYHISRLDEVSQTLFEMKYLLEKTDGEIAEMIGMSKNAVSVRIHRMTNKLRETMNQEGCANV